MYSYNPSGVKKKMQFVNKKYYPNWYLGKNSMKKEKNKIIHTAWK